MTITFATAYDLHKGHIVIEHSHSCHEIVYYDEGCSGVGVVDNTEYKFGAGDIVIIPKGSPHKEMHCSSGRVMFIGFTLDDEDIKTTTYSDMSFLRQSFQDVLSEIRDQAVGYEEMMTLSLRKIILHLRRCEGDVYHSATDLSYCREYIEENFTQQISLKELAANSGYSYDYFRHLFTSVYGRSPSSMIMSLRLSHAMELLSTTDMSCTEIAHSSGFFDSGQMSKLFKKTYKRTPSDIRKKKKD